MIEKAGDFRWFKVVNMGQTFLSLPAPGPTSIKDSAGNISTVTPPAPQVQVTWVRVDASFNAAARREGTTANWQSSDAAYLKVHFGFRPAATPVPNSGLSRRYWEITQYLAQFTTAYSSRTE